MELVRLGRGLNNDFSIKLLYALRSKFIYLDTRFTRERDQTGNSVFMLLTNDEYYDGLVRGYAEGYIAASANVLSYE
jgi:hypothetical protein